MGGGFVQGLAYYAFFMLDKPVLEGVTWTEILAHRPLIELDTFATGEDIPGWNEMVQHWRNDEYWRVQDWYRDEAPRNFSAFQISGWFDDDFPGTRANWELMQQRGVGPQSLVIGPWKHGYNVDRQLNGYSFGPDSVRPDIWLLKQKWYDGILKGLGNELEARRVEYFVLGSNEWRTATQWPPAEVEVVPWYFHSGGVANSSVIDGRLAQHPPGEDQAFEQYSYDPQDPPTNWYSFDRMQSWQDVQSFPYDFKDIEARHDVATFTSPVLDDDLTIAGDILIDLHASTDVLDTDWWVHLTDVYPDNSSVRLTVGLLRARFRNLDDPEHQISGSNFETEELLSGDLEEIVRYRIAIPAIANTFRAGHRIRIAVFNALDNYSFPNSNTGGDEATVTDTVVGTMRIHHDADHPSHVLLPVLPR
jgi:putative CocE/NonD family hydrolase